MRFFITSTEPGIGKTIVSSILVQSLTANYWKPIQAGNIEHPDSKKVSDLITKKVIIYPETYKIKDTESIINNTDIKLKNIIPPSSTQLIIESTGSILTPIDNNGSFIVDLLHFCDAEAIIVWNSNEETNHIITSIQLLQTKEYPIKGIVSIGKVDKEKEKFIHQTTGIPFLFNVPLADEVTKTFIKEQATLIKANLVSSVIA